VQRIRKDSEPLSSPVVSTTSRTRRESDRPRNETFLFEGANPRNAPNPPTIREVKLTKKNRKFRFLFSL
jgi:hypothetical protein